MLLDGSLPVLARWRAHDDDSATDHSDAIATILELTRQTESGQIQSIKTYLRNIFGELLGFSAEDLDRNDTLIAMGATSLGITRIRTRIEADFMIRTYNLPKEAAMGYAESLYPEYRKKIKSVYTPPASCGRYCCGWIERQGLPGAAPGLSCNDGGLGELNPVVRSKSDGRSK